uniref:Uncharacterized protein n=1 Tax=Anguilla anguilla TaxID=7936 RepID=A0A0E9W0A8_ANGAN
MTCCIVHEKLEARISLTVSWNGHLSPGCFSETLAPNSMFTSLKLGCLASCTSCSKELLLLW